MYASLMKTRQILFRPLVLAIALCGLLELGCAPQNSNPAVPLSPTAQQQILNADKLLADAVNGAVKAVIALRDQGKVSQADTTFVETYCAVAAKFSDSLDTIVTSSDPWSVQRSKIISLVQTTAFPLVASNVSSGAAALIVQIGVVFNQIKGQVGL